MQGFTPEPHANEAKIPSIIRRFQARGALIEDMDIAVASIAMAHGFGVATCNARHFGRIEGLRVDDWSGAHHD
jgi:predicted nucleic acid-binding protein